MARTVDARRQRRMLSAGPRCVIAILALSLAVPALAQEEPKTETPPEPVATVPQKIVASEVPTRATEVSTELRKIRERVAPTENVDEVMEQFRERSENLEILFDAPELARLEYQSARVIDNLNQVWLAERSLLTDWQSGLQSRAVVLTRERERLLELRAPWQLTLDRADEDDLPDAIVARLRSTLADIDAVDQSILARRNLLLTAQNTLSEQSVRIDEVLNELARMKSGKDVRIFATDSVPLWHLFRRTTQEGEQDVTEQVESTWRSSLELLGIYVAAHDEAAIGQLLLFLILVVTLTIAKRRHKADDAAPAEVPTVIDVLQYPVASSLLLVLPLTAWIYPNAPIVLTDFSKLIVALPVYILLRRVVHPDMRVPFYLTLFLYILDMAGNLAFQRPLPERLALLTESTLALAGLIWVLRKDGFLRTTAAGRWWRAIIIASKIGTAALALAIVVNVLGAVSLAHLLSDAVLTSAYFGFGVYAINLVLKSLLETLLKSRAAKSSHGLRRYPELFRSRFIYLVNVGAVVLWLYITLDSLSLWETITSGLFVVLTTAITVGTLEVSLANILFFVIALWLGAKIARFVQFVLEEDVYPRVRLPRGVPSTITTMVRYAIFTLAFFAALAAAGIELGKFTILAGAVGIGVGFGMQNIVNNFVSGLILAFERPIQPGDTVEVGTLFGRVKKIGVRASVIRTWSGSEVIVPNGDLISKEVINWTLSDPHRRLEMPVGVAYGTDPRKVIEILTKVAVDNPSIMRVPEPNVYFIGFGASSLDFELRGWISNFDESVVVKTQLNLAITDALNEAGIEIPFPQRDLHLRSVADSIGLPLATKAPVDPDVAPGNAVEEDTQESADPGEKEAGSDEETDSDDDGRR